MREDQQIAMTILQQLGGKRLEVMTGAKDAVALNADEKYSGGVKFKIGRNDAKVTHVRIRLTVQDTYDAEYLWVRGADVKTRAKDEGIYADMLGASFERNTGMVLSLGTMGRR